jgi:type I restriction enzyme R subunit
LLKFKVDYNDVRARFKAIEEEQDEKKLSAAENKQALLHPTAFARLLNTF